MTNKELQKFIADNKTAILNYFSKNSYETEKVSDVYTELVAGTRKKRIIAKLKDCELTRKYNKHLYLVDGKNLKNSEVHAFFLGLLSKR